MSVSMLTGARSIESFSLYPNFPMSMFNTIILPSFVPLDNVNRSINFDDFVVNRATSSKISILSPINTPEFIERSTEYSVRSYEISGHPNIILTRYKAMSINVVDYDYLTVIDSKTKCKFNASDSLVRHACTMMDNGVKINSKCQLRNSFGSLSDIEIACIANAISNCYNSWKYFPNETSYDNVMKFIGLIEKIKEMKLNDASGTIKNQIEEAREEIDRKRKLIAELEKKENDMYEQAADAMNILEENGYDPDKVLHDDFYSTVGWDNDTIVGWEIIT